MHRSPCGICGSTAGPGHKHGQDSVLAISFVHLVIWGVPALMVLAVAFMFVKSLITGEPAV